MKPFTKTESSIRSRNYNPKIFGIRKLKILNRLYQIPLLLKYRINSFLELFIPQKLLYNYE